MTRLLVRSLTHPQQENWIRQAMGGDSTAFGHLVRAYFGLVLANCRARLRKDADAEDATQETFMRAHKAIQQGGLHETSHFAAWLRGIARHVCVDMIRRDTRINNSGETEVEREDPSLDPAGIAEQKEDRTRLLAAIDTLPETCREVLFLHYFNEMTYDQMAAWLGVARATVNDRLRKGRQILRQRLKQMAEFPCS